MRGLFDEDEEAEEARGRVAARLNGWIRLVSKEFTFPEFFDWAIVVVFYAALHYVQGALVRDHQEVARAHRSYSNEVGQKATGLNELVRKYFDRDVRDAYLELFDRGQEARYRWFYRKATQQNWKSQLALYRVQLETIKAACL